MINKFKPHMVGPNATYQCSTTHNFEFTSKTSSSSSSKSKSTDLVRERTGAAGLGALDDHCFHKAHGWVPEDYNITHNVGRGGLFLEFRNFAMHNMGIYQEHHQQQQQQQHLRNNQKNISSRLFVFSVNSSDIPSRVEDFHVQMELVRQYVPQAKVESYASKDFSLVEQMRIVSETAIFITVCGGGAVTAVFLPEGATVILYYHERGGVRGGRHGNEATQTPAMLNWDLFNSITHLRVHWLPKLRMNEELSSDQMAFVSLIRYELKLFEMGVFQNNDSSNNN
mmetsp:Transcript_6723/g.8702  ORF Transcript_6723/g.8702 Transcript_6723/m.8702 type:complete len:282 (-) Transcript_6723:14-859(-)